MAAPADRRRDRAARRHSRRSSTASGASSYLAPFLQAIRAAGAHRARSATFRCSASLFAGPPFGIGMLTARLDPGDHGPAVHHLDLARRVRHRAAGAQGSGLRRWLHDLGRSCGSIVIPYTRVGVIGGVMLALGRALGETMAVTFVIGNAHQDSTLASSRRARRSRRCIANEFTDADRRPVTPPR